jgi:hypothetical protein
MEKEAKLSKRNQRIYNNAYNNPSQYDIEGMKDCELTTVIINAITDRRRDEQNGTFKFKYL